MSITKVIQIIMGIIFASMPFWLNIVILPSWKITTRKISLAVLFTVYNLLLFYLLTKITPTTFNDTFTANVAAGVLALHWIFVAYSFYRFWPQKKNNKKES